MENPDEFLLFSNNFRIYRNSNEDDQTKDYLVKEDRKRSNMSENHQSSFGDSAYHSNYSCSTATPHSSGLGSSQFSTYSSSATPSSPSSFNLTKSSISQQFNNLDAIEEHCNQQKDYITLTPVTQNAQRISAFHITTPKNEKQQTENLPFITKRPCSKVSIEEFQSTPKKFKRCDYDTYSTPQKHKKPKRINLQKLHSAPSIENFSEDESELPQTPEMFKSNQIQSTPKRTPLQSIQQNVESSTPIKSGLGMKLNMFSKPQITVTSENKNSVSSLLNCPNDIFESIVNADSLRSPCKTRFSSGKKLKIFENNENDFQNNSCQSEQNENKSAKTIRRFLKFNSQSSCSSTNKNECKSGSKKIEILLPHPARQRKNCPAITSVIEDRLKAKKRVNAERLANLNKQNSFDIHQNDSDCNVSENINCLNMSSSVNIKRIEMDISPVLSTFKSKTYNKESANRLKSFNMDISPNTQKENKTVCMSGSADMEVSPFLNNHVISSKSKTEDLKYQNSIQIELDSSSEIFDDGFTPSTPTKNRYNKSFINDNDSTLNMNVKLKTETDQLEYPTTPPRKSSRSSSTSSQKSCIGTIDKEKFQILYPTIPETPQKTVPKKLTPKKNRKCNTKSMLQCKRVFYNGATYLNIIGKLEPFTIVLENIFQHLSDKDLLTLSMTTKLYRNIIHGNLKANLRLINFIKDYKVGKENYCKQSQLNDKEKSDRLIKNNKVKQFSLHNEKIFAKRGSVPEIKHNHFVEKSPPVSPSKRKFHEYQKILKNLSDKQRMAKCPRCAMASRIISQAPLESFPEINSIFEVEEELHFSDNDFASIKNNTVNIAMRQSTDHNLNNNEMVQNMNIKSVQIHSNSNIDPKCDIRRSSVITQRPNLHPLVNKKLTKAFSVDSWQGQLRKMRLLQQMSNFEPYGECTSLRCKFKYCLECNCEFHPKQKCRLTATVSPTKEDIQNGILEVTKSPKKSSVANGSRSLNMRRKSLKRLCFN